MQLSRDLWHFSNLKKSSVPPQRSILSIPVQILSDPKSVKKNFVHTWYICSCYLPLPNERHLINLKPLNKPALSLCQCERASNTLVFPKKRCAKDRPVWPKMGICKNAMMIIYEVLVPGANLVRQVAKLIYCLAIKSPQPQPPGSKHMAPTSSPVSARRSLVPSFVWNSWRFTWAMGEQLPTPIELDDGKMFNRKALYLMVKTHGFL